MTKKEAIGWLKYAVPIRAVTSDEFSDFIVAVNMAIDALRPQWIPCSERLPEERDSIFAKLYGTEKWRDAMFRKTSKTVIITVEHLDGTGQTAPCHTIDGEWNQSIKGMGKVVAWMPLPEPWGGDKDEVN